MFRMIARWLISRSIDEDRRVPNWLRRWIDRDDELKQFERLSRQLGSRLENDARGWIASQVLPTGGKSAVRQRLAIRHQRNVAWSWGALGITALAACTWFALVHSPSQREQAQRASPGENQPIAQASATAKPTTADIEWLATAWKTNQTNLDKLRARAWASPGRKETSKLPDLSAIVESAEAAGSKAGHVLATLDRSMELQQRQLTNDVKTAFSFFAYRLPASLARLVGWRPDTGR